MQSLLRAVIAGSAFASLLSSPPLAAQVSDQWVGTWKLNIAQSKYPAGAPKTLTVTFEKAGTGLKVTAKGTNADGTPLNTTYLTTPDGKDSPVTGSPDFDSVSLKMIDPMTRHLVRKKGGKEVQTVHSVLAKDGKHFTSTTKGVNAKGQPFETTSVYDKQ